MKVQEAIVLVIILVLVGAAAGIGIFYRTTDPQIEATGIRGEHVVYQGSGLYRYNPASFAREGVVWDVINLFIALPLFAIAILASLKGSLRGRLLLGGLLAYFFYVYLSCAMMYAFNNFFLVYISIFSLSMIAFVFNSRHIDVPGLPSRMGPRFPRRLFIGYSSVLGLTLVVLWLARIIPMMRTGQFPEDLAGLHTLGSQALDLGLLVPMAISTAVLLWKKSAWGYFLLSMSMAVGLMMFISIPSWITVPLIQDGKTNLFEAIPFFVLSLIGIGLAAVFFINVRGKRADISGRS
jgi:hypothetical protein